MKMHRKDEKKTFKKPTNSYIQPYHNLNENKSKETFNLGLKDFCKLTHFIDKTLYHPPLYPTPIHHTPLPSPSEKNIQSALRKAHLMLFDITYLYKLQVILCYIIENTTPNKPVTNDLDTSTVQQTAGNTENGK